MAIQRVSPPTSPAYGFAMRACMMAPLRAVAPRPLLCRPLYVRARNVPPPCGRFAQRAAAAVAAVAAAAVAAAAAAASTAVAAEPIKTGQNRILGGPSARHRVAITSVPHHTSLA